jgi:hypothetical protein
MPPFQRVCFLASAVALALTIALLVYTSVGGTLSFGHDPAVGCPRFGVGNGCIGISLGLAWTASTPPQQVPAALVIPLSWVVFALSLSTFLLMIPFRFRGITPRGYCQHCGYNLTGNVTGRCPECGAPFPHDEQTASRVNTPP